MAGVLRDITNMAPIANPPGGAMAVNGAGDPFVSSSSQAHPSPHRYSSFDNNLFSQYSSNSPSQAKRALEAHLKDTDRRIQDASRLGTTLLQQRKDLSARLKDVEQAQNDNEIGPELRKKLTELEKEYNEVGKESARAFLPKGRVASSNETADSTRSPSAMSANSRESPTKVTAPSRRQRNQPTSRVHDIEFAAEISTSLLSQVRQLQAVLAEKDEALKQVSSEKSQLESEAASLMQRIRHMDESEQRYKDENWNLETQLQDLQASHKTSTEKEQRLTGLLKMHQDEKAATHRELEDLKANHEKLSDEHAQIKKQHDAELHGLRRDIASHESEKQALHKKVEDMTAQNTELAKAVSSSWNTNNQSAERDFASEAEDANFDETTPERTPEASPTKGTPRHGGLESETLKSSLNHAHRMIQNLKNNIHREKTEKIELKRMLQDARDELESRRSESGSGPAANTAKKRRSEAENVKFKKPLIPGRLGANRNSTTEVLADEEDWEDQTGERTPSKSRSRSGVRMAEAGTAGAVAGAALSAAGFDHAAFGEEPESTDAFETANEREDTTTETEAFQTGAESLAGESSDELTETEEGIQRSGTVRANRPPPIISAKAANPNRRSLQSTASISGDEADEIKTPVQAAQPKYRLKLNRNSRRSGRASELFADSPGNSPALSMGSSTGTPQQPGKSLGDELDALDDDGSTVDGTPSRLSEVSPAATPETQRQMDVESEIGSPEPLTNVDGQDQKPTDEQGVLAHQANMAMLAHEAVVKKTPMVDAGMMTEPWQPEEKTAAGAKTLRERATDAVGGALAGFGLGRISRHHDDESAAGEVAAGEEPVSRETVSEHVAAPEAVEEPKSLRNSMIEPLQEKRSSQALRDASAAAPNQEPEVAPLQEKKSLQGLRQSLGSTPVGGEPLAENKDSGAPLQQSLIVSQATEPVEPAAPMTPPRPITAVPTETPSPVRARGLQALTEAASKPDIPLVAGAPLSTKSVEVAPFTFSSIASQHMEPTEAPIMPPRRSSKRLDGIYTHGEPPSEVKDFGGDIPGTDAARPGAGFFRTTTPVSDKSRPVSTVSRKARELVIHPDGTTSSPIEPRVYGGGKGTSGIPTLVFGSDDDDDVFDAAQAESFPRPPLMDVQLNAVQNNREVTSTAPVPVTEPLRVEKTMSDEGSQTMVSGDEIDNMMRDKSRASSMTGYSSLGSVAEMPDAVPTKFAAPAGTSPRRSIDAMVVTDTTPIRGPRRPASAGSMRGKGVATAPPLPPDHTQKIAAAAGKVPATPSTGNMGPPTMPASAYRNSQGFKPKTPAQPARVTSRDGTTPRPRHQTSRSEVASLSRRTSVSSFASELDERFNITRGQVVYPNDVEPATDPRMIQAITQTMIGEYLWKYTRKAGRSETSSTRHRRFFWIHPYTRTLYWSEQDPSTAGRNMMKAKSVAIEAVRVITDDNAYPPGLHRKSLVVVTPGREVVFTAPTSQRHETWFNALSYLLLRTGQDKAEAEDEFDQDDVDEFNPGFSIRRSISRMTGRSQSRISLSSYNSRTTRTSSPNKGSLAQRQSAAAQRTQETATPTPKANHASTASRTSTMDQGSMSGRLSSLSGLFRPPSSMRGRPSFSTRRSKTSMSGRTGTADGTIYDASVVSDSAEDLRAVIERQEKDANRLENVRACCDGRLLL